MLCARRISHSKEHVDVQDLVKDAGILLLAITKTEYLSALATHSLQGEAKDIFQSVSEVLYTLRDVRVHVNRHNNEGFSDMKESCI